MFSGVSNSLRSLNVTYKGKHSRTCAQSVSIWRSTTSSWVKLDSRSVGTTEVQVDRIPGGTPGRLRDRDLGRRATVRAGALHLDLGELHHQWGPDEDRLHQAGDGDVRARRERVDLSPVGEGWTAEGQGDGGAPVRALGSTTVEHG